MHGDLGLPHGRLGQARLRQLLRQRLDQLDRLTGHDPSEPFAQPGVIHSQREVIGRGGGAGVDGQHGVNQELLAVPALAVQDAVVAPHPQTTQFDPVRSH